VRPPGDAGPGTRPGRIPALGAALFLTLGLGEGVSAPAPRRPDWSTEVRRHVAVDAPIVALVDVQLIDGSGAPPSREQTILVDGARITMVGPEPEVSIPPGAEVLELRGRTVIPGLVGLHEHTHRPRHPLSPFSAPRLWLAAGVTTAHTAGSAMPTEELALAASIAAGAVPGPALLATGPYFSGPGGSPAMLQPSTTQEARREVRRWAARGATGFKLYRHVRPEIAAAVIDEAHLQDATVTGHLCSLTVRNAVAMGIDRVEHGLIGTPDFVASKQPGECPRQGLAVALRDLEMDAPEVRKLLQLLVEEGVAMTSTLAILETHFAHRPQADARALAAMAPALVSEYEERQRRLSETAGAFDGALFRKALEYERAFFAAGGLLVAGSDPGRHNLPGFGNQRTFELLVEAGLKPWEAVRVSTWNGAVALGLDSRVGRVAPGLQADLVVLKGDLAEDPSAIREVELVFRLGTGFRPATLLAEVDGQVGTR